MKTVEICSRLSEEFSKNPNELEFYLPQLIYLLLNDYEEMQTLQQFLIDNCKRSLHFSLQMYLLIRSAKDSRGENETNKYFNTRSKWQFQNAKFATIFPCSKPYIYGFFFSRPFSLFSSNFFFSPEPPKKKKIIPPSILRWRMLCNQLLADIQKATEHHLQDPNPEELFHYPIKFMDEIIGVAQHLMETQNPDQYGTDIDI